MMIDWIFCRFSEPLVVQNFGISRLEVVQYSVCAKLLILFESPLVELLISVGIKKIRLILFFK